MAGYYTALVLSLAGALWLIPGARLHVLWLILWLGVSVLLDLAQAYEMKLFVDFFGFLGLAWATIQDAMRGKPVAGKNLCALLGLAQVAISATAYGVSYGLAGLSLPYEAFSVLMETYGFILNGLFLVSVWALFWGVNVRDRVFDSVRSLGRFACGPARVHAPQKAYSAPAGSSEHSA